MQYAIVFVDSAFATLMVLLLSNVCYPHMPIGKVWIYRFLFGCFFVILCVCTVTDFSAEDKASCAIFCRAVHRRPGQGISHFGELCSHRSPKSDE